MRPIQRQRVDACVYEQLLGNIKTGVWKAGDKLPSESELCAALDVSRVSVRSALQKLQALGFIEVKRAIGSFVCGADELFDFSSLNDNIDLTRRDFKDIAELRCMIEEKSIEIILAQNGEADLDKVEQAYQGMVKAVAEKDLDAFTLYDHQFHQAVILATGNNKFIQIAQIFREDFFRYLRESNKFILRDRHDDEKFRSHFEQSLVWHTELRNALRSLDADAVAVQRRHITRNIERLDYYFEAKALEKPVNRGAP